MPCLPGASMVALRRSIRTVCTQPENASMRSVTSLLRGGEGSVSSWADILGAVTDLLHSPGPSLHSVSASWGAPGRPSPPAGTQDWSVLLSVNRMLQRTEQMTVEGIHSAACYMTSQLTHSGPNYGQTLHSKPPGTVMP